MVEQRWIRKLWENVYISSEMGKVLVIAANGMKTREVEWEFKSDDEATQFVSDAGIDLASRGFKIKE